MVDAIEFDCDGPAHNPYSDDGYIVIRHQKNGVLNPGQSLFTEGLYLTKNQRSGNYVNGYILREELKKKPVLNANALDFILDNQYLIPDEIKKRDRNNTLFVFFWGTEYCDRNDGKVYIRYFCYWGGKLRQGIKSLNDDWGPLSPAAVRI